jgi:hypothetical protein
MGYTLQTMSMLVSLYIVTWAYTWGNGTGHTSLTYFCLWLFHYQPVMASLPIEKKNYSTKLPDLLDFYKEKSNIENLSDLCLSPKSFRGFNQ